MPQALLGWPPYLLPSVAPALAECRAIQRACTAVTPACTAAQALQSPLPRHLLADRPPFLQTVSPACAKRRDCTTTDV